MKNPARYMLLGACFFAVGACEQTVPEGTTAATAPPPGAKFLEAEFPPEAMASSVWSVKGDDARKAAAAQWADMWIPEPGWFGTVEKLEQKDTGTNVWFSYPASAIVGGSFWVAAEFPGNTRELSPARGVMFSGRVEKVEILKPTGAPELRIIVRNARILSVDGK